MLFCQSHQWEMAPKESRWAGLQGVRHPVSCSRRKSGLMLLQGMTWLTGSTFFKELSLSRISKLNFVMCSSALVMRTMEQIEIYSSFSLHTFECISALTLLNPQNLLIFKLLVHFIAVTITNKSSPFLFKQSSSSPLDIFILKNNRVYSWCKELLWEMYTNACKC